MESKLYRVKQWYRPLHVEINDREFELSNIIIYNKNGVILEVGYGYFDSDKELTINGEITKKIKIDFNNKINYIVLDKSDSYKAYKTYNIYIHIDNIKFEDLGQIKRYDSIYNRYMINGIEVIKYRYDLAEYQKELSRQAKNEVEKLVGMFGVFTKGNDENELTEIFDKIKELNKKILKETEKIKNFEV